MAHIKGAYRARVDNAMSGTVALLGVASNNGSASL